MILVLSTSTLYGQTLHALLFINEKEPGREIDRSTNMRNMKAFYRDIANNLGYTYNLRANSDNEFKASEVDREINNLNVQKNDIVVFYYGGHGYNQGQDIWPTLSFKDKNYWLSDILRKLNPVTRDAKLVLCIADCCNKGNSNAPLPSVSFNTSSAENFKALFTGFSGKKTILISSSKQGQLSFSDLTKGPYFGNCFRASVYNYTDNSHRNPTWEEILENAKEQTLKTSNNRQEPQFQIIHSGDPFGN